MLSGRDVERAPMRLACNSHVDIGEHQRRLRAIDLAPDLPTRCKAGGQRLVRIHLVNSRSPVRVRSRAPSQRPQVTPHFRADLRRSVRGRNRRPCSWRATSSTIHRETRPRDAEPLTTLRADGMSRWWCRNRRSSPPTGRHAERSWTRPVAAQRTPNRRRVRLR